jgi:hypothetical protein
MCWNQDISLNTFIFAILALLFIYLANTFTKYKNVTTLYFYLFFLLVAFVQLMEFLLWRNLSNKKLNTIFSKILCGLVLIQPIVLIFMIPDVFIKIFILLCYICVIIYIIYSNPSRVFRTSIGKNGHLFWEWSNFNNIYLLFICLIFYIIPLILFKNVILTIITLGTILFSLYINNSFNTGTFGSVWCWLSNVILLFVIIDILLIKPYYEYNSLC